MNEPLNLYDSYRSLFPVTEQYTYLNHAAASPTPMSVVKAVMDLYSEFSHFGIGSYSKWMKRIKEVRIMCAGLIKADNHEIAFVQNTSGGLSTIAAGLKWKQGDIVLVPRPEFPANVYPWLNLERQGVTTGYISRKDGRFGVKELEKSLRPQTRLISVSSVDFLSGFSCNLEEVGSFCQKKGILLCVDAIQSLGAIPVDVKKCGIHFLVAGSHKWLLSSMGCGILFISKDVNEQIHPVQVGWKSVVEEEDFFEIDLDLKIDALRFEPGSMNIAGIYALGAALELILEIGVENIYDHVLDINNMIFKGLKKRQQRVYSSMEQRDRSGILTFIPSVDPQKLFYFLLENKIMVSLRGKYIRLAPHFYNNHDDAINFFKAFDNFCFK